MKLYNKLELKSNYYFYLILLVNILNIGIAIIKVFKSNQLYFFENIFQTVYFYCILFLIIASLGFYKQYKNYLFFSIIFFLDLPFHLKTFLQSLFFQFSSTAFLFSVHIIVLLILILLTIFLYVLIYKLNFSKYLIYFLIIFYSISFCKSMFAVRSLIDSNVYIPVRIESISKNSYILLFDEYPSEDIFLKYVQKRDSIHITDYLIEKNFKIDYNVFSNFPNTEKSTLALLTGEIQENSNINKTIKSLTDNVFSRGSNYNFYPISILDDTNRPNSLVSTQFFEGYTNLSTRYFLPYLYHYFSKRGVGNFTDYDDYHLCAINKLNSLSIKKEKHIVFIHFYTPHIYPFVENQSFTKRLQNANYWMIKAINVIEKNDSTAGVVILSDHGLRWTEIPPKLWNKNILFYKNIEIDTSIVNKAGLVSLFRATKF